MRVPFTKMHGAANDFVVVDHRERFLPSDPAALFALMCDRRRGIGADGVLLLERDPRLDYAMRYYNADGGEAEFCGNGARCLARFALARGLGTSGEVRFASAAGPRRARELPDGRVALWMGVVGPGETVRVESGGRAFEGLLATAGVPHFVVPVARVEDVPLAEWAPALRRHARFGAAGANVDFVSARPDGRVAMRTYERGVEGETLACGSGAVASALWAVGAGTGAPVTVRTAGGDDLVVGFERSGGELEATLTGPALAVFEGTWVE